MPSLLHLNGPPGIGKSTLAALYAERHPGTLNLDADRLHELVGGWQDPEQDTHQLVRPLALALASAHLAGGRDVIMPQYLGRLGEIERFARVASDQGADFREVVLLDDRAAALDRFEQRVDDSDWGRHNRSMVARLGGPAALAAFYDDLQQVIGRRPSAVVVRSKHGAIKETYALTIAAWLRIGRAQFAVRGATAADNYGLTAAWARPAGEDEDVMAIDAETAPGRFDEAVQDCSRESHSQGGARSSRSSHRDRDGG